MKEFVPLRSEAEERGRLIKAASERHAPSGETCELIENFGQSETRMIEYVKELVSGKPADSVTMQRLLACNLVEEINGITLLSLSGLRAKLSPPKANRL